MEPIILKNQEATAAISQIGAEMLSYTSQDGRERIWEGDPAIWEGHGPVLFPIIGSLYENKTKFNNEIYEMPKHGIARKALFTVISKGENFVELCYESNDETKKQYPFDFSLYVRHSIDLYGFTTVYRVINRSQKSMPACIGGHPAFVCPMEDGYSFEDYALIFPEKETGENLLVNGQGLVCGKEILDDIALNQKLPLAYNYFAKKDTLLLAGLRSRSVQLVNQKTGTGLRLEFPRFPVLAIWTKPEAPYLCLEPWLGLPDDDKGIGDFEDKPYTVTLLPQEELKVWYTMTDVEGANV